MGMNFVEAEPMKHPVDLIVVLGEKIGKVEVWQPRPEDKIRYHASIKVSPTALGLIQGFGDTREEAVKEAVTRGRRETLELLHSIDMLEERLLIKEEETDVE